MVRLSIAILRKVCCWICRWFFLWYRWIAGKVTSKNVVVSCTFFVFLQCTGQAVKIWHLTSPLVLPPMSHFEHDVIHKTGSTWRIAKSVRVWSLENVLFSCAGPRARNSLPSSLHELADTKTFKRQVKTFLLNKHSYKTGLFMLSANSHTFYYWYSVSHPLFHSRLKTFLFCKSFPPQPFLFFFRTDYMDSPDCLLLLLSISVFTF